MEQKSTWIIKICCVIAAFSLWLYIVNVGDYDVPRQVTVNVEPINVESVTERKLAILPGQKFTVTLNVKGTQSDIELNKDQFKVVADMSAYALSKGEIRIPVRIDRQPVNVTVLNSESYYIKVNFDDYAQKTVPVELKIDGRVKAGFFALDETISPTEVTVSGAAKYVNQVARVEAKKNIDNMDKDLNVSLPLKAVDASGKEIENVTLDMKTVSVTMPIKRTKTVAIKVNTKGNLSKDLYLKSLSAVPDKIEIAGGDVVNSISYLETEPIDLSSITSSKDITVKIIDQDGITLLDSDGSVRVKVVVEKIINKNFSVNISIKNVNDNFTAALSSEKATVTVTGVESAINEINSGNIYCFVDLASINSEGEHNVEVSVSVQGSTSKVSVNPETVKVTLKKKEVPANAGAGQNSNTTTATQGG